MVSVIFRLIFPKQAIIEYFSTLFLILKSCLYFWKIWSILSFQSYIDKFLRHFFAFSLFFFSLILSFSYLSDFLWFFVSSLLISCYFLNNFLLCENEKHFLLCSISHPLYCGNFHCSYCFIVGIESRVGFCKLEYKVLAIIWHKITWKYTNNSSKYTYTTV